MTTRPAPRYALLADVDGPICNPDAKAIIDERIIPSLVRLLESGIPVVFNTGRSADFVEQKVFVPILKAEPKNLHLLHAVCEKGVVWISVPENETVVRHRDKDVSVPQQLHLPIRTLVDEKYVSTMFYDETKESMISIERQPDVDQNTYTTAQAHFVADVEQVLRDQQLSYTFAGVDSDSNASIRLDSSIIAVDIESPKVGKDLGALRAYEMLKNEDALPQEWWTIGDSVTDYAMAEWLHDNGQSVQHVDVAPTPMRADRRYGVVIPENGIHDAAGGAFVESLARMAAAG